MDMEKVYGDKFGLSPLLLAEDRFLGELTTAQQVLFATRQYRYRRNCH